MLKILPRTNACTVIRKGMEIAVPLINPPLPELTIANKMFDYYYYLFIYFLLLILLYCFDDYNV